MLIVCHSQFYLPKDANAPGYAILAEAPGLSGEQRVVAVAVSGCKRRRRSQLTALAAQQVATWSH